MPDHDPYAAARHHVGLAIEFLKLSESDAERLLARHEGAMRYDLDTGLTYADGSTDTGAWLRGLDKSEPSLLGKAPTPAKPTSSVDLSGTTVTNLMVASKRGDAAATAELERRSRHGDGTPTPTVPTAFNLTAAMARAHAGDAAAQAALDSYFNR